MTSVGDTWTSRARREEGFVVSDLSPGPRAKVKSGGGPRRQVTSDQGREGEVPTVPRGRHIGSLGKRPGKDGPVETWCAKGFTEGEGSDDPTESDAEDDGVVRHL